MPLPLTNLSIGSALICQTSSLTNMHRCSWHFARIFHITMHVIAQICTTLAKLVPHRDDNEITSSVQSKSS